MHIRNSLIFPLLFFYCFASGQPAETIYQTGNSGATNYNAGSGTSYTFSGLTIRIKFCWGVFDNNATSTTWSVFRYVKLVKG